MKISGFEKLTLIDYPGKMASIIFTQGCNFNCAFCQNSDLIKIKNDKSLITEEEIFTFLEKRKNLIDGIVISGGEPLVQKDIKKFIKKIKALKLNVKLDTNGSNPTLLKELIDENLIDYVAMDIKGCISDYHKIIGKDNSFAKNILESIKILNSANIAFEFRTTIYKEYHDYKCLKEVCKFLGSDVRYYLQNFVVSKGVLNKNLHGFSIDELNILEKDLRKEFPNVRVRDLQNT